MQHPLGGNWLRLTSCNCFWVDVIFIPTYNKTANLCTVSYANYFLVTPNPNRTEVSKLHQHMCTCVLTRCGSNSWTTFCCIWFPSCTSKWYVHHFWITHAMAKTEPTKCTPRVAAAPSRVSTQPATSVSNSSSADIREAALHLSFISGIGNWMEVKAPTLIAAAVSVRTKRPSAFELNECMTVQISFSHARYAKTSQILRGIVAELLSGW